MHKWGNNTPGAPSTEAEEYYARQNRANRAAGQFLRVVFYIGCAAPLAIMGFIIVVALLGAAWNAVTGH